MVTKYTDSVKSEKAMALGGYAIYAFCLVAGHLPDLGGNRTLDNPESVESPKAMKAKRPDDSWTIRRPNQCLLTVELILPGGDVNSNGQRFSLSRGGHRAEELGWLRGSRP